MQYTFSKRWHPSTRLHGVLPWSTTIRTVPFVMPYGCNINFNTCIMRLSTLSPKFRRLEREAVNLRSYITNHLQLLVTVAHIRPPQYPGTRRWGGGGTTHRKLTFVVGFSDWILFFWQKAMVSIPVKTGSKAVLLITGGSDHWVAGISNRLSIYKTWFGDHASVTRLLPQQRCIRKCSRNPPLPLRSWECHLS